MDQLIKDNRKVCSGRGCESVSLEFCLIDTGAAMMLKPDPPYL